MAPPRAVKVLYDAAPLAHRKTMLIMRERILHLIPQAHEVISYGMPAFELNGNVVAGIMAAKKHVGYYPFSGSILQLFPKELAKYGTTKSAIHVPIEAPLSKALLSKLLKARISQCPVKRGEIDLAKYKKFDGYWKSIGIAAPARRGLVDRKLYVLNDLRGISKSEFLEIHAIGPKATALICAEMKRMRITFRPERSRKV